MPKSLRSIAPGCLSPNSDGATVPLPNRCAGRSFVRGPCGSVASAGALSWPGSAAGSVPTLPTMLPGVLCFPTGKRWCGRSQKECAEMLFWFVVGVVWAALNVLVIVLLIRRALVREKKRGAERDLLRQSVLVVEAQQYLDDR